MKKFINYLKETNEEKYILGSNSINGIEIDEDISQNQLFEYQIVDRENEIDNLIMHISETKNPSDKILMKEDLKQLMSIDDEWIFSSIDTNDYISSEDKEFNETCEELLAFNKDYLLNKDMDKFNI